MPSIDQKGPHKALDRVGQTSVPTQDPDARKVFLNYCSEGLEVSIDISNKLRWKQTKFGNFPVIPITSKKMNQICSETIYEMKQQILDSVNCVNVKKVSKAFTENSADNASDYVPMSMMERLRGTKP